MTDFIFLGSKITEDGDYSHEIKSLLLGRKAMTNLVRLKSRAITLPTKVYIVKGILISWLQAPSAVILELKKRKSVTVCIVSLCICQQVMGPDAMILVF